MFFKILKSHLASEIELEYILSVFRLCLPFIIGGLETRSLVSPFKLPQETKDLDNLDYRD